MNGNGDQGRIAGNLMRFARVLRRAGLPVGPGRMLEAVAAVEAVGLGRREDFYWALHAVFVNRRDQRELFDQAFHIFWRNPKLLERMAGLTVALPGEEQPADRDEISRRVAEAMADIADAIFVQDGWGDVGEPSGFTFDDTQDRERLVPPGHRV